MITKGDESAMNLEVWGVFFSQFLSFSETFVRIGAELLRTPLRRSSQNAQNANFALTESAKFGALGQRERGPEHGCPGPLGITLLALLRLARYSHSVHRSLEKELRLDRCETQANSLSGKPCEVEGH
jgi:hypothetical protein